MFILLILLVIVYGSIAVDPPYGQLSVKGTQLEGDGKPVALHGMSLFWSQWMDKYWNDDTIKALKCPWNSNVVRAAMGVDQGGYLTDKAKNEKLVTDVVDAAIKEGIYVIIDWHADEKHQAEAVEFFDKMSKKYAGVPNVLYEDFNEPKDVSWSNDLVPYHKAIIAAIRKNDPKNIIILGTPTYSQKVDEASKDPIKTDPNVMYTLHYYAGSHKQELRDKAETAIKAGLPLFVTEYGTVNADGGGAVDAASSKEWWDFLDKNKISYVNWSVSDKAEGASALKPGTAPTTEAVGSDANLTESGKLVKDHMKAQDNGVKCAKSKPALKMFILLILLVIVYGSIAVDPPYGQLSVKGTNLTGADGKPVALHGMSLFWSQWMDKYWNADTIKALKCPWNSNVVRAAMGVDQGGYLTDKAKNEKLVETVVDAAIAAGIYVIIDWHADEKHQAEAVEFFDKMSKKYAGVPNVLYEDFNEPKDVSWSNDLVPYHKAIIAAIRKNDPKNIIILGTPTYSQKVDEASQAPIKDDPNIMYTLHYYAGTHKQELRDKAETAIKAGLPLFVTEYGTVNADGGGAVDAASSKEWWDFLDKNKISYVNWAVSDKAEGASALKPGTAPTTEAVGSDANLTESGKLVKDQMKAQDNGVKCAK
ncbi:cellulase (glycosyl hydrolase family 5) domain-containing protein [Ditylenchus destructor]|nr:cellulase (glycosyl hydrolase family 5) domain-containing protein [Ditylenchus destructor]